VITHDIREVTPDFTYVVFSSNGETKGKVIWGDPSEEAIKASGEDLFVTDQYYKPPPPAPTLAALKDYKREQVNSAREGKLNSGFNWRGYPMDADPVSRMNIIGEALAASLGKPFPNGYMWRTADNQVVPMTGPDVLDLADSLRAFMLQTYQDSWRTKAAIESSSTKEELDKIK
jgi:hypothetical protein